MRNKTYLRLSKISLCEGEKSGFANGILYYSIYYHWRNPFYLTLHLLSIFCTMVFPIYLRYLLPGGGSVGGLIRMWWVFWTKNKKTQKNKNICNVYTLEKRKYFYSSLILSDSSYQKIKIDFQKQRS